MNKREFVTLIGGAAAVCFGSALAQQPGRVWQIGILHGVPPGLLVAADKVIE